MVTDLREIIEHVNTTSPNNEQANNPVSYLIYTIFVYHLILIVLVILGQPNYTHIVISYGFTAVAGYQ